MRAAQLVRRENFVWVVLVVRQVYGRRLIDLGRVRDSRSAAVVRKVQVRPSFESCVGLRPIGAGITTRINAEICASRQSASSSIR